MSIHIDSCVAQDTIVVTTRSSVYKLIVLLGDRGDVLVRGGRHFTDSGVFCSSVRLPRAVRSNRTQSISVSA